MAFSLGSLTAYKDQDSFRNDIWTGTADYADTLQRTDVISVYNNVKANVLQLPKLAATATIADGDNCSFSASGDDTITQADITMVNYKVQKTWCVRTMEDYFTQGYLGAGQHYGNLGSIESNIVGETLKALGNAIEVNIWNDSTATAGSPGLADALIVQMDDNGPTPTGTPAAITSSNALDKVDALAAAVMADRNKAALAMNNQMVCYIGHKELFDYYLDYETTHGTKIHAKDFGETYVHGTNIPFVPVAGLSGTSYIMIAQRGNVSVGIDLMSDTSYLKFGMDQYEQNIWGEVRFKMGVGFRDVSQIVFHAAA